MNGKPVKPPYLGGIDGRALAPPSAAREVRNMRWDPTGMWREAGGTASLLPLDQFGASLFTGVTGVLSLFWWARGGQQRLMWEQLDNGQLDLVVFDGAGGGTWRALDEDRTHLSSPWPGTQYAAAGGWAYFLNGFDRFRRYDGEVVLPVGFDAAPPPPHVQGTVSYDGPAMGYAGPAATPHRKGIGEPGESWTRGYAVTWVNDLGSESPPSAVVFATATNNASYPQYAKVVVDDAPAHVRGIRLWATQNVYGATSPSTSTLHLLAEWGSNQGLIYADGIPDALLGRQLDTSELGLVPARASRLATWQGTMWLAVDELLVYSAPVRLEQYPSANTFQLGSAITALYATRDALLVFTARTTHLVKGDAVSGFRIETLSNAVGCSAPRGVVEVPGTHPRVFFISDVGILALGGTLDGGASEPSQPFAGRGLGKLWRDVNRAALVKAWAVYHAADREVWFGVPVGASGFPSLGLVYHLDLNEWSVRRGYEFSCVAAPIDGRRILFAGSYRADQGVMVYGKYSDIDGEDIAPAYTSSWMAPATPWERSTVMQLAPLLLQNNRTVAMTWQVDRREQTFEPDDTAKLATFADEEPLSTWDVPSIWLDDVLCPVVWSAMATAREFSWTLSATDGAVGLVDVRFELARAAPAVDVLDSSVGAL